jgi:uncharacterized protein YndB with AHSA1/START domain
VAQLDVRVGGRFRIVFGGAEGKDHEVQGVYKEVVPNRKLVFTWTWPNSTPERESLVTIEFKAAGGGTELAFLHQQLFDEPRATTKAQLERIFVSWSNFLGRPMATWRIVVPVPRKSRAYPAWQRAKSGASMARSNTGSALPTT